MDSSNLNLFVNTSMRTDITQWLMTRFEYGSSKIVLPDATAIDNDPELRIEIGMKWLL